MRWAARCIGGLPCTSGSRCECPVMSRFSPITRCVYWTYIAVLGAVLAVLTVLPRCWHRVSYHVHGCVCEASAVSTLTLNVNVYAACLGFYSKASPSHSLTDPNQTWPPQTRFALLPTPLWVCCCVWHACLPAFASSHGVVPSIGITFPTLAPREHFSEGVGVCVCVCVCVCSPKSRRRKPRL